MAKRKRETITACEVLDMWETDLAQAEIDNDAVVLFPCMVCNCLFEEAEVTPVEYGNAYVCNECMGKQTL
jgi:hypothetical protein